MSGSNVELELHRVIECQIGELDRRLDANVDEKLAEIQKAITGIISGQLIDFSSLLLATIDKSNKEMFEEMFLELKSSLLVEIVKSQQQERPPTISGHSY